MELTAVIACSAIDIIEAITPVEAEQTEHGQVDTHADTSRTFHLKRVEMLETEPAVACLKEGERIDSGLRVERQRITQLKRIFREDVPPVEPL